MAFVVRHSVMILALPSFHAVVYEFVAKAGSYALQQPIGFWNVRRRGIVRGISRVDHLRLTRSGIPSVLSCVARSRRPDLLTADRARALAGYVRGALPEA